MPSSRLKPREQDSHPTPGHQIAICHPGLVTTIRLSDLSSTTPVPVVLDTNILIADFHWTKAPFRLLLAEAEQGRVRLVVPKLVVQEAARNYAEKVVEAQKAHARARRSLAFFGRPNGDELDEADVRSLRSSFEEELSTRVEGAGGLLASYPSRAHADIVGRLLDRRKPFGPEGKGYRDTLIWATIVDLAAETDRILFVSSNHRDFAHSKNGNALHPDLQDDLAKLRPSATTVELVPDLDVFVNTYVQPSTIIFHEVSQLLSDEGFLAQMGEVISDAINRDLPPGTEIDVNPMDSSVEDLTTSNIETGALHNLQIQDARVIDPGAGYVFLYVEVDADLEGFQYKGDYYAEPHESPIELLSADWNEWFVHVGISTTLGVEIEARYDQESKTLSDGHVTATQVSILP
jgi:hypothetical protein